MSEGKTVTYRVENPAVIAARRIAAARDRHDRAIAAGQAAQNQLAALQRQYGVPVRLEVAPTFLAATVTTAEEAADAAQAWTASAQRSVAEAIHDARDRDAARRLGSLDAPMQQAAARLAARAAERREPPDPNTSRRPTDRIDRAAIAAVLSTLPAAVHESMVARCMSLAEQAANPAATGSMRANLLATLKHEISTLRRADELRRHNMTTVESLYEQLDGLSGEEVRALRGELRALDPAKDLPLGLGARVRDAATAARRAADRAEVLAETARVLCELGYVVDTTFVDDAGTPGGALVALPGSQLHGVTVRERNGELKFRLVRFDPNGAEPVSDRLAAGELCDAIDRLTTPDSGGASLSIRRNEPEGSGFLEVRPTASPFRAPGRVIEADAPKQRIR